MELDQVIDLGSKSDVFMSKLREYDRLIRFASRRLTIQGVVDPDDLYQEGIHILDKFVSETQFDANSVDFRKLFKCHLWHGLINKMNYAKAKKRDHTKTAYISAIEDSDNESSDSFMLERSADALILDSLQDRTTGEDRLMQVEAAQAVEDFIERLIDRLDAAQQRVLQAVISPPEWEQISAAAQTTVSGFVYLRTPRSMPQQVLASFLGVPLSRFRKDLRAIRRTATQLQEDIGVEFYKPKVEEEDNATA